MSTRPSSRGPSGQWEVEAAELHRVYPPAEAAAGRAPWRGAAGPAAAVLQETQQRAVLAEHRLSDAKAALEELKADRDAWREQAQRLALFRPGDQALLVETPHGCAFRGIVSTDFTAS